MDAFWKALHEITASNNDRPQTSMNQHLRELRTRNEQRARQFKTEVVAMEHKDHGNQSK